MKVRETWRPVRMAANASYTVTGTRIGGFLPSASGTIAVTDADGSTLIAATAVTAGQPVPFPMHFNTQMGGTVTLASDAAGTLFV